jgi:hypothetical protein
MLAGSEAIDTMIDAAAGIASAIKVADFHFVEAAAPRLHAECAENGMFGFQSLDGDDLGAAPPTAQRNLVVVSSPPPLQRRRPIQHGAGLSSHTTFRTRP